MANQIQSIATYRPRIDLARSVSTAELVEFIEGRVFPHSPNQPANIVIQLWTPSCKSMLLKPHDIDHNRFRIGTLDEAVTQSYGVKMHGKITGRSAIADRPYFISACHQPIYPVKCIVPGSVHFPVVVIVDD